MKGIRTDCHTGEESEVELDYKIEDDNVRKVFVLIGGPTGYESFYIRAEIVERIKASGWLACVGRERIWDRLFIKPEEMCKAFETVYI